jgi:predicted SAM-dependent methyltransferase
MRLNLGCGDDIIAGWINCDLHNGRAEIQCDVRKLPFEDNTAEMILASHLLEHFDFKESFGILTEWKRVLQHNGLLIIEVPNLTEYCKLYLNPDKNLEALVGIYGYPWQDGHAHKFGYSPDQLRWTLQACGFRNIQHMPHTQFYQALGNMCMRFECKK